CGSNHLHPDQAQGPRRPPHRGPGGLRGGSDLQREAGQRHPGRLPPGLRAPATRTDRLPAARPRLPHGPVLGEPEPTDSHRFPGTGDGRAHGVSALTPRRRILGARANTGQTEGAFMAYHADSSDLDEKEILTWDLFGQSARELAQTIADSDYDPEIVIAVARGGLLPAGALAYALGLKLSDAINVEFYTDVHETLPDPILLAPMLDIDAIKGKKLLVVDDVAIPAGPWPSSSNCCASTAPRRSRQSSTRSRHPSSIPTSCGSAPISGSSSRGRPNLRWSPASKLTAWRRTRTTSSRRADGSVPMRTTM